MWRGVSNIENFGSKHFFQVKIQIQFQLGTKKERNVLDCSNGDNLYQK